MKQVIYYWLGLLLLLCCACDEAEPIPGYLSIPDYRLSVSDPGNGSSSAEITEVWVFIDGAFLGVYDLPALVPVVETGEITVRLEAGIHENGIGQFPDIYPFYAPWSHDVTLIPDETVTLNPVTDYVAETKFAFIEAFELGSPLRFDQNQFGMAELVRTQEDVFEGDYSGRLEIAVDSIFVELYTGERFSDLLDPGFAVYLEVNYKSDVPVLWGILGNDDPLGGPERLYDPGFRETDEWSKIYFNIGKLINTSNFENYAIGFQAIVPANYTGSDPAVLLLDNIKLVHF